MIIGLVPFYHMHLALFFPVCDPIRIESCKAFLGHDPQTENHWNNMSATK